MLFASATIAALTASSDGHSCKRGSLLEAITMHENRFSKIESELAVLRWMVGFVIALLLAVVLKLFFH
ncbi:hypothetical protein [Methylocystis sp. SC2]|uniref:hypothetical protein n=1 Tax=Methylocystis sp. (strain SC2) TaxID=187303 RepID=UPI0005A5455F|nr:hypothetical protein [Methylocystis sp. SC2]